MTDEIGIKVDKTFNDPFFELYYAAREGVESRKPEESIPYALIVTIRSKKMSEIYDKVVEKYVTKISPIVETSTRVRHIV